MQSIGLGAAALVADSFVPFAQAQPAAGGTGAQPLRLPLKLTSLTHHIGISVRDVLKSADFYSRIFGGKQVYGEKEPQLRYFIAFVPAASTVDAGDIAIGKLGTLGSQGQTEPLIDHHCVEAVPHSGEAWRTALHKEGIRAVGSIMFDNDNIPIQIAGATDEQMSAGEVTKMPSLYDGPALVSSIGFDHVILRVTDLDASVAFYKKVFGLTPRARERDLLWFSQGESRLGMRKVRSAEKPGLDTYGVKVAPFNRKKVVDGLSALGASIEPPHASDPEQMVRFADIDGIKAVITSVS